MKRKWKSPWEKGKLLAVKGKYPACIAAGVVLYLLAGGLAPGDDGVAEFLLKRNPWGEGDREYYFLVEGLEEEPVSVKIPLGEQKLTKEQGKTILFQAAELLCERMKGDNPSLGEVRDHLQLPDFLPEYGLSVSWKSDKPEFLSSMGTVQGEMAPEEGEKVYLNAKLSNGIYEDTVEIPVTVFPPKETRKDRFIKEIEAAALSAQTDGYVELPREFEGRPLSYRNADQRGNEILPVLGFVAAGCLYMKEKNDTKKRREKRDAGLLLDYSEVLSRFVVLTGAGYTIRQAWKKMVLDYERKAVRRGTREKLVYGEMRTILNQMETGISEQQSYRNFGKNCGLRCYIRFSSILANNLHTGSKNLRQLLEEEVAAAFEQRKDLAKRLGEEASTKLLIPLFLMLGVVMVMIVSPAFLTLG